MQNGGVHTFGKEKGIGRGYLFYAPELDHLCAASQPFDGTSLTPVHLKGVIKKIMRIPIETLLLVCLLIIVFFL
jgi:hypothetical protein